MKVVQFKTIHKLLSDAEIAEDKSVNFTQFTSGRVSLRFMDSNGEFHNYMIERDGTHFKDKG